MKRALNIFAKIALLIMVIAKTAHAVEIVAGPPEQINIAAETLLEAQRANTWEPYSGTLKSKGATFWFRQKITLEWSNLGEAQNPLALSVRLSSLYDAYWDGALIGSNRHRRHSAPQYSRLLIPVSGLKSGEHMLALKITGAGLETGENINLSIQKSALESGFFGIHLSVVVVFFVSITSYMAALYFLWIGSKSPNSLSCYLAAVISFLTGSLIFLDRAKFLTPYPYIWEPRVEAAMAVLTLCFLMTVPVYYALRLNLKRPLLWLGGAFVVIGLSLLPVSEFDTDIRAFLLLGAYLAMICIVASRRGDARAGPMALAVAASLIALFFQPDEKLFFAATLSVLVTIELAVDLINQVKAARRLELLSERLRSDLLKRNLRPHFLMNSLTAVMEWIETSPHDAIAFIDDLAQEFRLLSDFADRQKVTIQEELALCNLHLQLMSRRLDGQFTLETAGLPKECCIPPALFHTLIENAFSHNDYQNTVATFRLSCAETSQGLIFHFSVPEIKPRKSGQSLGLGSKYIEARLEEFCGKSFTFQSKQLGSDWVSTIAFNKL